MALRAGVAVYCCAPHSRRCSHAVALLAIVEAYGWVQHAVTRQCSHVPDESFARHSPAHHAVLAVPPLQLYRHNIAFGEKSVPALRQRLTSAMFSHMRRRESMRDLSFACTHNTVTRLALGGGGGRSTDVVRCSLRGEGVLLGLKFLKRLRG